MRAAYVGRRNAERGTGSVVAPILSSDRVESRGTGIGFGTI